MKPTEQPWMSAAKYITDNYDVLSNEETRIRRIGAEELAYLLAAHAPQQWIPVSERLPEPVSGGAEQAPSYLVFAPTEYETIQIMEWCDGLFWAFGSKVYDPVENIATHWMPLPAPPVPARDVQPEAEGDKMKQEEVSTFNPLRHGHPEVLRIEIWRGEGVRVTRDDDVICQGRSVNDLLLAIDTFLERMGIASTLSDAALLDEVWNTLVDVCEFGVEADDGAHKLDVSAMRDLMKRVDAARSLQIGTKP